MSEEFQPPHRATAVAVKRYGNLDGEATAVLLIGSLSKEDGRYLVLGLPFVETEHSGMWHPYQVSSIDGGQHRIRITTVPAKQKAGLRTKPLPRWEGDYLDFADNLLFAQDTLITAWQLVPTQDLDASMVQDEATTNNPVDIPIEGGDSDLGERPRPRPSHHLLSLRPAALECFSNLPGSLFRMYHYFGRRENRTNCWESCIH